MVRKSLTVATCLPFSPYFSPLLNTFWVAPEGRGFSPAEIAARPLFLSRASRSLRPQAAWGAGQGNSEKLLVTAGLKPRPSKTVVRNAG